MATKVFKAVVPQYLGSRQSTRKKTIFVGGAGGPVVVALYARSSSLALFDTENQKGGTLTVINGSGELLRLQGERGYLTTALPGLLAVSFLGNGKQIQIKCNGSFWFFVSRHSIVLVDERKVTKIRLTENLNQGSSANLISQFFYIFMHKFRRISIIAIFENFCFLRGKCPQFYRRSQKRTRLDLFAPSSAQAAFKCADFHRPCSY